MTKKQFLQNVTNSNEDIFQLLLNDLANLEADYCVIGGLAINAYTEPIVSLDLDIVVAADKIDNLCKALKERFMIEYFERNVNLSNKDSDLMIQFLTDVRYQPFIDSGITRNVLDYDMKVACLEDVLQGKIWAYSDEQRRGNKRQKDLADMVRLIVSYPHLLALLPDSVRAKLEL